MKVRIPSRIKIGGHWVKIFYEDKLYDNHAKYGQSRFAECEIALQDRDMSDSRKAHTLLHELMHFIDNTYNNYKLGEDDIDALATGIHTLLVDLGIEFDWGNIK